MNWIVRPPVELIFTMEGIGILAVLAAITILWGRSAKRERIPEPYVPEPFVLEEGDDILLLATDGIITLKVNRIKWMADEKGATIFAGKHSIRQKRPATKEEMPPSGEATVPEEPKGDCPL